MTKEPCGAFREGQTEINEHAKQSGAYALFANSSNGEIPKLLPTMHAYLCGRIGT